MRLTPNLRKIKIPQKTNRKSRDINEENAMADEAKKKKLVIKKSKKGGTIADKITKKRKEDLKKKKASDIARKRAAQERQQAEAKKSQPPAREKTPEQQKSPGFKPAETTTPATAATPQKPPTRSKAKGKSHMREDILRKEEHKKFFLKNQSQHRSIKGLAAAPSSSVPKKIKITEYIQVGELARKLNIKTSDIIAKLMHMGVMVTITQSIDAETASLVASEYGCEAEVISLYEETLIEETVDKAEELVSRPPVVTVMGHVDHGKTKLLDSLRETDIVSKEAGGITQHIGAYQVQTPKGKITFLDTPGHAAFTSMRARGAKVTDIVVLVVAADDGIMPQTVEAIRHAQDANVPIIVAINKSDLPEANPDRVLQQLGQYNLVPEDWGGTTPVVQISALKKTNLDKLEDVILTTAEVLELKANPTKNATGTVIEATLDQGRGPVATILVSNGTLRQGRPVVVGKEAGKIRAMINDRGQRVEEALPATPVEILGINGVPNAGDPLHMLDSEKEAKTIMEKRQELSRQQQAQKIKKVKLENLNEMIQEGAVRDFKMIIKADVQGSVEAIQESLEELSSDEIRVQVIYGGTGEISESDVMLASAGNAMIIAFNTRANSRVRDVAEKEGVDIKNYNIIYQVIDDVKAAIGGLLSPEVTEEVTGEAEVRERYKISNIGVIAGCMVTSGVIKRNSHVRLIREGASIFEGGIKSLKRFKDDAAEVKEGFECGIMIDGYNDIKNGDVIEAFEKKEMARNFDDVMEAKEAKARAEKKAAEEKEQD